MKKEPLIAPWGYPLDAFDETIKPGDDFFAYANGAWLKRTEIPSDRSGTGFSVEMLERNEARIDEIINDVSGRRLKPGSEAQKIRDLYNDFMDVERIEANGLDPIQEGLARIRAVKTHKQVAALMADPALNLGGPFNIYVTIDAKNPQNYIVGANHSGLGMPDRTYYLRPSDRLKEVRIAYKEHLARMLTLLGEDNVLARAEGVFALEKEIAERHWEKAKRRNADLTYNRLAIAELETLAPGMPWAVMFDQMALPGDGDIVVRERDAFPLLAQLFEETPVDTWRDYLLTDYISAHAYILPNEIYLANFAFYGTALYGREEPRPRDRRAIGFVNNRLGHAVGKEYIDRYFAEDSKRQMVEMFENVRAVLRVRINELDWMADTTKAEAQAKLEAMTPKIAYPEKWRDYSDFKVMPGDLIGNVERYRVWAHKEQVARLGTKVDKREWRSAPHTVNAFYNSRRNEVFIPAGYIQSPLFDPNADPAVNYGAIGSILGHEIGHGFDDQGSKYNADGVLQSWWTPEDRAQFDALGDKLVAQFNRYEPLLGLNVNGRQTLGENIGDLAGVVLAYHAYKLHLDGKEAPILDGFTGAQRFFLGRAQARRYKRTEQSLRVRVLSGVHSPMNLRVNGIVRNMDEWYAAFDVQPGDTLYLPPDERVRIW